MGDVMAEVSLGAQPYVGVEVPPHEAAALLGTVGGRLAPGEAVLALVATVKALPSLSHVVVTDRRLLGFKAAGLAQQGFVVETPLSAVASAQTRKSYQQREFLVTVGDDGEETDFGDVHGDDAPRVLQIIDRAASAAKNAGSASPVGGAPPAPVASLPTPAPVMPPTPAPAAPPDPVPAPAAPAGPHGGWRYNPPPTWPAPPVGWTPPPGWQPDPSWGPVPPGWQLWVPAAPRVQPPVELAASLPPAPVGRGAPPPVPPPLAQTGGHGGGRGLFGGRKRIEELEAENARLRQWVADLNGMEPALLAQLTRQLQEQTAQLEEQVGASRAELDRVRRDIVQTEGLALLQVVGVYEYQHPLADSVAYKAELAKLKDKIKTMARNDRAVQATTHWSVNGSAAQGTKMVRDFSKLMLRAYNAEADNLVRTMRPYKLQSAIDRLDKSTQTIARLGKTMDIRIAAAYHQVRIRELTLTADYLAKVEEEKERVRAERERQREEDKARREFEREKARLLKERSHVESALARLIDNGDEAGAEQLRAKLAEVESVINDVEGRQANTRAGYVYVISNIGAFGENMVKIGMTRRLDPMDRVRELGDASVPFRFDVHALIFSDDAVGLENRLHQELADQRVNRVNLRREFFNATPAQVRDILRRIAGQHLLEYTETPEALEWRTSQNDSAA
ncbi:hypothetical protein GCM10010191_22330 [Actinomadura vinacea]|uniref:Bacteriophage T5 Orf172 DNA-binding domain-containing protein n=1 Tax=Actinomadura vinacea TaxID=115336 RepID=A0ABN3ISP4_9ACTN